MAIFYPESFEHITNESELLFAQNLQSALKDDDIFIIHGQKTAKHTKNGIILGETDFILVSREYGLLVIEVKGGDVQYNAARKEGERWGYGPGAVDTLVSAQPDFQARNNLTSVNSYIRKKIPDFAKRYANGCGIALPQSHFVGNLPTEFVDEMVFTSEKCRVENIREAVFRLFQFLRQRFDAVTREQNRLNNVQIEAILQALRPAYKFDPDRKITYTILEKHMHRWTKEQREVFYIAIGDEIEGAVSGVAGSGKTTIAITLAQREAQAGKRVLMLCYNKGLASWLNAQLPSGPIGAGEMKIDTYHGFVSELAKEYDRKKTITDETYWITGAPNLLFEIATNLMPLEYKYDVIIVDEGQDFHDSWWQSITPLFRLPKGERTFIVFYDPDQNVYGTAVKRPANLPRITDLLTNCRNTKQIGTHCKTLIETRMRISDLAANGDNPAVITVSRMREAISAAKEHARTLVTQYDAWAMNRIVILTSGVPADVIHADASEGGFTNNIDTWRHGNGVLFADAGAFKGLESDLVLFIDNDKRLGGESAAKRYVAQTRAKFELHVYEVR